MSTYTENLNLFKYDTSTDGQEVFSIDTAMNANWDKIDTSVVKKSGDTMTGHLTISHDAEVFLRLKAADFDATDTNLPESDIHLASFQSIDKNGKAIGYINTMHTTTGNNFIQLHASNYVNDVRHLNGFIVGVTKEGKGYFSHPQIMTDYVSGTSGYRIWSNGYCEQWGRVSQGTGYTDITVTLPKKMKDTNYQVFIEAQKTSKDNADWNYGHYCYITSANTFICSNRQTKNYFWRVYGYLAADQY